MISNEEKNRYFIKVKEDGSTELINPELVLKLTQIAISGKESAEYVWKTYKEFENKIKES